jgi:CheY-like chemotaxis protein
VNDALDLFGASAREKNIRLNSAIAPRVPAWVAGDATRLRQILVNLLGNAIKFTDSGEVKVTLHAEAPDIKTSNQRLTFAVSDTGIGIPADGMERLFKSFSQVDASTTRRFGGTGLGLAISKRLAGLMGGNMWVESEPGRGSIFHFTVLMEPQVAPKVTAPRRSAVEVDATLGRRCPLRVLVAEDNPVNQRVATLMLQRLGYRATTVGNGLEALAALELADYDAVLMDVEMPEVDGCEATRRIRANRRTPTRPWIIALTAGAMPEDRERALAAGMNDFLTKPVRTDALSAALARAHAAIPKHSLHPFFAEQASSDIESPSLMQSIA